MTIRGNSIIRPIVECSVPCEAYHQKYRLQQRPELMKEFSAIYPSFEDFINSTAAARVNGYVSGYGECEALQEELNLFGLSPQGNERLLDIACARPLPFPQRLLSQ